MRQLKGYGFTDLTFAVGYLAHLIQAVFGDGSKHDVSIEYHEESMPLGTAGALATIDGLDDTFLAMNGDVLTAIDYADLYRIHREARKRDDDRHPPARRADRLRRDSRGRRAR